MATVNKDFKIKSGLIVEGTNGTINGYDILTKDSVDVQYIVDQVGGSGESTNTPDTLVLRDGNGDFAAGTITADLTGNVTGNLTGDVTGNVTGNLTGNVTGNVTGDLTGDVTGNVTGNLTGNVTGNASTATALETARTIELTGDVTGSVSFDGTGNVQISTTVGSSFATDSEVATAKSEAIADAGTATDAKLLDYTTTANLDTTIDGYGYLKSADLSSYATETYVDTAVSNLVDGAPALLDTLNELAAAIGDDENYATTVSNLIAGKQNTLTAGTNIDITNDTVSVIGLASSDISDFATAAQSAGTGYFDPAGSATTAENNANQYTNGEISTALTTAQGYANTAETNAGIYTDNQINALDTDDIEEGVNNVYFTDGRAKDSAASLLTGATLTNITITGTGNGGLTITAENGVADSDTDDLAEGSTNLYFTDARAVDALEAVVPNFTEIDINSVATQVAGTTSVPVAGTATAYSWAKADYRSAEFLVKVAYGDHTEISKVLITLDASDNIAITEYGIVGTNGSAGTVSATISGNDVQLQVTTANNSSTLTVVGTLLV